MNSMRPMMGAHFTRDVQYSPEWLYASSKKYTLTAFMNGIIFGPAVCTCEKHESIQFWTLHIPHTIHRDEQLFRCVLFTLTYSRSHLRTGEVMCEQIVLFHALHEYRILHGHRHTYSTSTRAQFDSPKHWKIDFLFTKVLISSIADIFFPAENSLRTPHPLSVVINFTLHTALLHVAPFCCNFSSSFALCYYLFRGQRHANTNGGVEIVAVVVEARIVFWSSDFTAIRMTTIFVSFCSLTLCPLLHLFCVATGHSNEMKTTHNQLFAFFYLSFFAIIATDNISLSCVFFVARNVERPI